MLLARRILFCLMVVNLLYLIVGLFGNIDWLDEWRFTTPGKAFSIGLFVLGWGACWFFLIDSFVRQYDQENTLAIALAFVGVMTIGLTTVFYYLRWGHQPTRLSYNDTWCENCLNSSTDEAPPFSLTTLNYVIGGRLVGQSHRCPQCGSTIRTHCFYLLGIPLYSAGSFRVLCPATNQYILRRCEFYKPHIFLILLMPAAVVSFVLFVMFAD